jgi:hypothetical protein
MIAVPSDVRVWRAVGHTDMRRGMNGLALWHDGHDECDRLRRGAAVCPRLGLLRAGVKRYSEYVSREPKGRA